MRDNETAMSERNNLEADVVVVGGGPGGPAAATFVAMQGHRVIPLEKQKMPASARAGDPLRADFRRFPLPVLPRCRFSRTLKGMEVHFTPEQETQLSQIATHAGTDAERLVKDAALRLLQEEARFRAAVREGIAQADRGEFLEEEEMDARLEQMLRS
jgi:flavin-dependent dehydrogenase